MVTVAEPFDLTGPLPTGTHLLEASAGTGKTYAIAALSTRYLAEGHTTIDQLLLITFGRAATQELRERVRTRLVGTHRALDAFLSDGSAADDDVTRAMCAGAREHVAARRGRLADAITGFDMASIETTHGFCQRTLERLGLAADTDPLEAFTEDLSTLTQDVVADLYLARYGIAGAPRPGFALAPAMSIAKDIIGDPMAEIIAGDDDPRSPAAQRASYAQAVRTEHLARRRRSGITTWDDLLTRVDDALRDPVSGSDACAMLRRQFPVVMVDEFQDTDPLQWDILQRAFHTASTLLLIGDPKQAIYAFRGGDIDTYLKAATVADRVSTLATNRRTDAALVDRITEVFGDTQLGAAGITVRPVSAHHQGQRLVGGPDPSPWRVRTLPDSGNDKPLGVKELRRQVAVDVTADIVRLLGSDARLTLEAVARDVRPGDIAVLVDTNREADLIRQHLRAAGVNAVVTTSQNVFSSPAAHHWLTMLRAIEKPQDARLTRSAMITPFLGYSGRDLAIGDDEVLDGAIMTIRGWGAQFRSSGIAGVMQAMSPGMTPRVLSQPDGERLLTDINHVGEELHAMGRTAGLAGLLEWLTGRITDSAKDAEESSRRLDTDAAAVQIVTVHRSKGLEFPITYVPFAWNRSVPLPERLLLHDEQGRRITDVRGPDTPQWRDHLKQHRSEDAGERLRLLYVALTRASCQVVLWWVRSNITKAAPLQRLVGARIEGTPLPLADYPTGRIGAAEVAQILGPMAIADAAPFAGVAPRSAAPDELSAAVFDRRVDVLWRRTSYSALTAAAHEAAYRGEDSPSGERDDEPATPTPRATDSSITTTSTSPPPRTPDSATTPSPMADLPAGAIFGLVAHRVFELFDSSAADQLEDLERCSVDALNQRPLPDLTAADLAQRLLPSVHTPLGPLADGRTLSQIPPGDRLSELDFEFPLAGGDIPHGDVDLDRVADTIRTHLAADDPLVTYPEAMTEAGLGRQQLMGFLSGSIDAVLRVGSAAHPRFVVADYKTNWLGGSLPDRTLNSEDYSQAAMTDEMIHAHYPLQALLYQVAVHRFLRWRLAGYTPERHLGGVLYLFVRGMCGPDTPSAGPAPCGVFSWQPPTTLITELSDVLSGDR